MPLVVCTLHWYFDERHLADVMAEMQRRGPPRLRGFIDDGSGAFMLREGTHRINAAHRLGVAPVLVCVPWWRSRRSLVNARHAARIRGLTFDKWSLEV